VAAVSLNGSLMRPRAIVLWRARAYVGVWWGQGDWVALV